MEIPIQVAVRICPKGLQKQQQQEVATKLEKDIVGQQQDDNGNVKCCDNDEEEEDEKNTKCCIQTIPLAATQPGYMANNGMSGVMGALDNGVGIAAGLIQVGPHSFPVTHALPLNCAQNQVYHQTVFPLISLFMEGFDASVVSYGQKGCGKTYTLYGYGFDCSYSEADQGIVQRCVREIFTHMTNHPERTYAVNIGWVEICGEVIRDLLGVGNVHCMNFADVFHWLQVGLQSLANSKMEMAHTLFTLTLEQQWVSKEGLIQHRLSTASFSDLCATERLFMLNSLDQPSSLPKDLGLQSLEHVVNTLTDPALMYNANGNIPYNQTTLTTLLKDSFGGRAQTLVILCVSPFERDINETLCNLQFAFKVQCVRNYVVMNTFSDDNTPLSPEGILPELGGGGVTAAGLTPPVPDSHFGLQFAASQWFKLVSNAEGLFSKLISSNAINEAEKEQIEEWLFLKQECEECLSSNEVIRSQKQLGPIQEAEEPEETNSEPETSCQQNSDNESDSESQRPDLEEKIELLMEDLSMKTDNLVKTKYQEFMENHPKAVMESQESFQQKKKDHREEEKELEERRQSVGTGGRRRSIQPGATLSSAEIAMLNRVAGVKQQQQNQQQLQQQLQTTNDDFLDSSTDMANNLRQNNNSPLDMIQKKLRKLDTDIEARLRQIKEVEETMQLKQNIITELIKNSDTRTTAKQRFHKKRAKLEAEYEKTKKSLAKAMLQHKDKQEIERLKAIITHLEQRLNDLTSIKHIAGESGQKVKKLQQSLHESKKVIDDLQKKIKKERKLKEALENEMKSLKEKENSKALVKIEHPPLAEEKGKHLKEVQARISHLDHVLKEKSDNLDLYRDDEQREGLRHEIRNLRRTRDHLLEQRCSLDRKLKRDKMLSHKEERKLLECDEAIEAIDAAIEFKNELICGHKSIDTSERLQREKGEQMLMARLNKLSTEEMRTLLYKYFNKVIDLRDSSRKLEIQLMQLEREKDAWEWKERVLSNAVRQARLEGERNAVLLQRQHEMKLTLMLRHLADETSNSSASFTEQSLNPNAARYYKPTPHQLALQATNNSATTCFTDSEYEWSSPTTMHGGGGGGKMLKPSSNKLNDMEMCPLTDPTSLTKYKPLDKFKDKERETKNKLFAKFQVLTRYAASHHNHHTDDTSAPPSTSSTSTQLMAAAAGGGGGSGKRAKDKKQMLAVIPQENLKKLSTNTPNTKVTRQKNKIIIQDNSRKN
ncbi:kinesin-like protein costa [Lucilia sericata]|uniref:kinesin-like protein costa n=1 Tax=Lucilia sericata TaxID=13632 RepID=UPI0018A83D88|nr:kinesin-like protein costa [Lucilia sericata]